MLAVVFSLEKWHHFTYGRHVTVYSDHKPLQSIFKKPLFIYGRHVTVCSDHKPLQSIFKKPLFKAPKRLQSMLMRTLSYDVEIIYRQGKQQIISDTLSRACLPLTPNDSPNSEFETVNMAQYIPVTKERLEQIRKATEQDEVLSSSKSVILRGWPDDNTHIVPRVMPNSSYKDELTVQNGVIFRGERLVIPVSLRSEMKKSIHQSHLDIEGCLRLARDLIFWPGMSSEIRQYISMCEVCQTYQAKQNTRESLMSHELLDRPWEKIGIALFSLDATEYLITVDYYSNFWEVDKLTSKKPSGIVKKLKAHFARYGCPDQAISDNEFVSHEFTEVAKKWGFDQVTCSPHHSNANGKVESTVKTVKRLLRKSKKSKQDPYLAILYHRNTHSQGINRIPAQRMFGRRTKTLIPTGGPLLQQNDKELVKLQLKQNQERQSWYYNKKSKDLPPLAKGDVVRMRPYKIGDKSWQKGVVLRRLDERSYEVGTDINTLRRNRVDLKPTFETLPTAEDITKEKEAQEVESIPIERNRIQQEPPEETVVLRRSQRAVKLP